MNSERVSKEVFTSDVQAGVIRAIFAARPAGGKQRSAEEARERSEEAAGAAARTTKTPRAERKPGS